MGDDSRGLSFGCQSLHHSVAGCAWSWQRGPHECSEPRRRQLALAFWRRPAEPGSGTETRRALRDLRPPATALARDAGRLGCLSGVSSLSNKLIFNFGVLEPAP